MNRLVKGNFHSVGRRNVKLQIENKILKKKLQDLLMNYENNIFLKASEAK